MSNVHLESKLSKVFVDQFHSLLHVVLRYKGKGTIVDIET
jgi:hypothetical protein